MGDLVKSTIFGGIYTKDQKENFASKKTFERAKIQLQKLQYIAEICWKKSKSLSSSIKNNLGNHFSNKQEIYWPVFIALALLCLVFVSRIAFAKNSGTPNNLPLETSSKLKVTGFQKKEAVKNVVVIEKKEISEKGTNSDLKEDIAGIVKNTPMASMIDSISQQDRTVAAFIVGIAMKESKFGVYSPKLSGKDCFNYWGFKGGGKTVSGGYTCFSSPEEAVEAVGKRIEKMVAKGVRTPAQAISWKCGSSCAGHDPGGVRKWIADVGINFYKIN